ncbi:MAG: hypothetical protein H6625_03865 [Bdellovibrionaceae bacterium]|nr:hypothetical protein [Pseudobdellovibrionaceae bacterium]
MIEYGVIIQARYGSMRRPGKIAYKISGKPLLIHQIDRLKYFNVENIVVATSNTPSDDITSEICEKYNISCFRGDENDVMKRYIDCAEEYGFLNIIRVGGDDPLIDPVCIYSLIEEHRKSPVNLLYASHSKGWIYGTAAELIELEALKKAHPYATKSEREHVVSYLRNNQNYSKRKITPQKSECRNDIYVSVDYPEDIDLITQIINHFNNRGILMSFSQSDLIELYDSNNIQIKNKHLHDGFGD